MSISKMRMLLFTLVKSREEVMKYNIFVFFVSVSLCLFSLGAYADDEGTVKACLANWGKHPFNSRHPKFRSYNTKVRVFGIGGKVSDTIRTDKPDLVLIKPNVSVMTKSTMDLLNPNGWYCLRGKVNVMSSTTINLHCSAHLASSTSGVTVLGGANNALEQETTVLGGARIKKVGCDGSDYGKKINYSTKSSANSVRKPSVVDEEVLLAQKKLSELGYTPGKADGIIGSKTINALREYQEDAGLAVTGELDDETFNTLKSATNEKQRKIEVENNSKDDIAAKLKELDGLRKDGIITDEEFNTLKLKIISAY